jgi:predicted RNase H-like nuclease
MRLIVSRLVLGIDAAWTARAPSGVALIKGEGTGWRCLAAAPSYASFLALERDGSIDWNAKLVGGEPDPSALLAKSRQLAGAEVDVIAMDLPLSMEPIVARRASDDLVSKEFGGRHCGTHSPSAERPGKISDDLRSTLDALGYPLACKPTRPGTRPALLEVYPHIALLQLLNEKCRLAYKTSKVRTYWPEQSPLARRAKLLNVWNQIHAALSAHISGFSFTPPATGTFSGLKRYEDVLDALICAWVGAEYLSGRAIAYGDDQSAIWNAA